MKPVLLGALATVGVVAVWYIVSRNYIIEIAAKNAGEKASSELNRISPIAGEALMHLGINESLLVKELVQKTLQEVLP